MCRLRESRDRHELCASLFSDIRGRDTRESGGVCTLSVDRHFYGLFVIAFNIPIIQYSVRQSAYDVSVRVN